MTISIRDRGTEEIVRREAKRSGRSITRAVRETFQSQERARLDAIEEKRRRLHAYLDAFHRDATDIAWSSEQFDEIMYGDEDPA